MLSYAWVTTGRVAKSPSGFYSRRAFANLTRVGSFDRYKSNLRYDSLTAWADRKIDKVFGQTTRVAVCVVKRGPPIGIGVRLHAFGRGHCAIDRHCFYSASLGVCHADITDAVWIFAHFGRDLFVAGHLLRARGVIAFLHSQLLEIGVSA